MNDADAPGSDDAAGRPMLLPPGWYPDPHGISGSRYWDGATWTEHWLQGDVVPQPTPGPALPEVRSATEGIDGTGPAEDPEVVGRRDALTIRRLANYSRWTGVAWMVLGAIQVISVFAALAGLWNLYAGWTRIRFATPIEQRLHTVPDAVRPLTGYVFIAVVNLLLGGFVGLLLVGIDLLVRDQILSRGRLFTVGRASWVPPTPAPAPAAHA